MKFRSLVALFAMFIILFAAGCQENPGQVITPAPSSSPVITGPTPQAPGQSEDGTYRLEQQTLYFPEGATTENAKFIVTYTLPVFLTQDTFSVNANADINLYLEELYQRISDEYLPIAQESDDQASMIVNTSITTSGEYTNVLFSESITFGEQTQDNLHTIVLDASGKETALTSFVHALDASNLIAQLVWNRMDQERDKYFGNLSIDDILGFADLFNGYYVTDNGFVLYFPAGTIAARAEGPILLEISRQELYPAFVGDMISPEDYERLFPVINRIANVVALDFLSFDSAPSPYIASIYLSYAVNDSDSPEIAREADVLTLSKDALLAFYKQAFSGEFPGLDQTVTSIQLSGDTAKVELMETPNFYTVSLTDALQTDTGLQLTGRILFSSAENMTSDVAGFDASLVKGEDGYLVQSFLIR